MEQVLAQTGSGFIDIHCHILPGLDDGAKDMAQTLEMLRLAAKDGVEGIVASPHIKCGVYDNSRQTITQAICGLNGSAKKNGVELYQGADIYISRGLIEDVRKGVLPLINDRNYLLLELPDYVLPPISEIEKMIAGLKVNGVTPVITHPERNLAILEDVSIAGKLIKAGAVCQLTAGSITGRFGAAVRKASFRMLKKSLVHAIASDAHDTRSRPPILSEAHSVVASKFGQSLANDLFILNPRSILNGDPLNGHYPRA